MLLTGLHSSKAILRESSKGSELLATRKAESLAPPDSIARSQKRQGCKYAWGCWYKRILCPCPTLRVKYRSLF